MTYYEAALRQLEANEKHHERALAKNEMHINLLCAYRDKLEDEVDIAAEMIAHRDGTSLDAASKLIYDAHEIRQAARDTAVGT